MVKWKQSGKVDYFEKNLRIQFDVVFDTESNDGIFDSLAPVGGELPYLLKQKKITRNFFA